MTRDFEMLFAQNWIEQERMLTPRARLTSYASARAAVFCAIWVPVQQYWGDRYMAFVAYDGRHSELVR